MTEKDSDQFKIRLDDDLEEEPFDHETPVKATDNTETKAPNQRIAVWVAIVISLAGILAVVAYTNVKKQIDIIQASGSTQMTTLSQDLRTKLSDLTTQSETLTNLVDTEVALLKKQISTLSNSLNESTRKLKRSEESQTKKLDATIASLQKQVLDFKKNTDAIGDRFKTIDNTIKQEVTKIDDIIHRIEKDLKAARADIAQSIKKQVEQGKAILAFDIQQKRMDKDLIKIQKYIENRFSKIEARIQAIENSKGVSAPPPVTPPVSGPSTPAGNLIEQDIFE